MGLNQALPAEQKIVSRIIDEALSRGLTILVWDGEAWACDRTTDKAVICEAMVSSDMDTICLYGKHGKIGSIHFIWNNGNDGEDVVSDHTASPYITDLVDGVLQWYEAQKNTKAADQKDVKEVREALDAWRESAMESAQVLFHFLRLHEADVRHCLEMYPEAIEALDGLKAASQTCTKAEESFLRAIGRAL